MKLIDIIYVIASILFHIALLFVWGILLVSLFYLVYNLLT